MTNEGEINMSDNYVKKKTSYHGLFDTIVYDSADTCKSCQYYDSYSYLSGVCYKCTHANARNSGQSRK